MDKRIGGALRRLMGGFTCKIFPSHQKAWRKTLFPQILLHLTPQRDRDQEMETTSQRIGAEE
jgi:hypothetical protein